MGELLPIFTRTLKERKLSTFIYSLGLGFFAFLFVMLYKDFVGELDAFVDSVPEAFNAFLGDFAAASSPEGWLAIELYTLFVPIILAIVGVGFGASAIGKEEDTGTLELLIASPVSRGKIFFEKALAVFAQLAIISYAVWLGVFIGTIFFDFDVSLLNVFFASTAALLLGLVFGYFTLAIQSLTGRRSLAIGIGSAVVAVTYLANVLSRLVDYLELLKYGSPFYYYDVAEVLNNGIGTNVIILIAAVMVFYTVAYFGFKKRDTGV